MEGCGGLLAPAGGTATEAAPTRADGGDVLAVEGWKAGPLGGDVHPGHVVHGAEHADLVVDAAVGLHALEQLLGVVQNLKGEDGS